MTTRTNYILGGFGVALFGYFGAYFLSVRTSVWEHKGAVIAIPIYRPFDGRFMQAMFTPAHLIDEAYLRRALWEVQIR